MMFSNNSAGISAASDQPLPNATNAPWTQVLFTKYPEADIERIVAGDDLIAAVHVSYWGYSVEPSDVDLFSYLDSVVDLDAEIPNGTFYLGMPK